jgi:hypothetical protein
MAEFIFYGISGDKCKLIRKLILIKKKKSNWLHVSETLICQKKSKKGNLTPVKTGGVYRGKGKGRLSQLLSWPERERVQNPPSDSDCRHSLPMPRFLMTLFCSYFAIWIYFTVILFFYLPYQRWGYFHVKLSFYQVSFLLL